MYIAVKLFMESYNNDFFLLLFRHWYGVHLRRHWNGTVVSVYTTKFTINFILCWIESSHRLANLMFWKYFLAFHSFSLRIFRLLRIVSTDEYHTLFHLVYAYCVLSVLRIMYNCRRRDTEWYEHRDSSRQHNFSVPCVLWMWVSDRCMDIRSPPSEFLFFFSIYNNLTNNKKSYGQPVTVPMKWIPKKLNNWRYGGLD